MLRNFVPYQSIPPEVVFSFLDGPCFFRPDGLPLSPCGLRIQAQLDELEMSLDNIAVSSGQPIPPWLLTVPICDLSLSHLRIVDTPDWKYCLLFAEHLLNHPSIPLYTDGSKLGDCVGSAMVCCSSVVACRIPSTTSVFTAKLYAISLALDHIETQQ
ncbi:uncharacterized protein LOC143244628 [Tachypleus tridentatus]|uniref:uncharacterized protein LOC143244628 n=1 Tax=Tachypleus tridentatus TaxID=6853 RepID=UPI003FD612F3